MGGIGGALLRYRIMAYVVGTALVLLVFVAIPLNHSHPEVGKLLGPVHGFLYIIYLAAALDMARRCRFALWQMAAMIGAGLVPLLAFVIEHVVTARVRARFPEEVGIA
jgi:integral membrane protein